MQAPSPSPFAPRPRSLPASSPAPARPPPPGRLLPMARARFLAAIGIVALGGGLAFALQDVPPEHAGAAKLFAQACASCHTIPDPERETDKAWLTQVKETS